MKRTWLVSWRLDSSHAIYVFDNVIRGAAPPDIDNAARLEKRAARARRLHVFEAAHVYCRRLAVSCAYHADSVIKLVYMEFGARTTGGRRYGRRARRNAEPGAVCRAVSSYKRDEHEHEHDEPEHGRAGPLRQPQAAGVSLGENGAGGAPRFLANLLRHDTSHVCSPFGSLGRPLGSAARAV